MTEYPRPVLTVEVVKALSARNIGWVEFAVETLAHSTTYGEVRLEKKDFIKFIAASHSLGFKKDDAGVLCRREAWKGLSGKSVEDVCQLVLLSPELLSLVVQAANRHRRTFPVYKTVKQEKQSVAAAYYAAQSKLAAQYGMPEPKRRGRPQKGESVTI